MDATIYLHQISIFKIGCHSYCLGLNISLSYILFVIDRLVGGNSCLMWFLLFGMTPLC